MLYYMLCYVMSYYDIHVCVYIYIYIHDYTYTHAHMFYCAGEPALGALRRLGVPWRGPVRLGALRVVHRRRYQ